MCHTNLRGGEFAETVKSASIQRALARMLPQDLPLTAGYLHLRARPSWQCRKTWEWHLIRARSYIKLKGEATVLPLLSLLQFALLLRQPLQE